MTQREYSSLIIALLFMVVVGIISFSVIENNQDDKKRIEHKQEELCENNSPLFNGYSLFVHDKESVDMAKRHLVDDNLTVAECNEMYELTKKRSEERMKKKGYDDIRNVIKNVENDLKEK